MKIEGSGSISQRHGSADPDPDPHQNVIDPEHWFADTDPQHSLAPTAVVVSLSSCDNRVMGTAVLRIRDPVPF